MSAAIILIATNYCLFKIIDKLDELIEVLREKN